MNLLIAFAAVLACSAAVFPRLFIRMATVVAAMARRGWRPPQTVVTPTKAENPFRGNGGAR